MLNTNNKNIIVHSCCAPCSTYPIEKLIFEGYNPTIFFYNPNIYPVSEYQRRKNELVSFSNLKKYRLIIQEDSYNWWLKQVKGLEKEPEKGKRCEICFQTRLEKAAIYAKENNFEAFTTTLTISPHKNSTVINKIGKEMQEKYKIAFLEENFKKNNGFKQSLNISKEYNLYRQSYCGCGFSIMP